jgi:hypothetical protein
MAGRAVRKKIMTLLVSGGFDNAGMGNNDIKQLKQKFPDPRKHSDVMADALGRTNGFMSEVQAKYYLPKNSTMTITENGKSAKFVISGYATKKVPGGTAYRPTFKLISSDNGYILNTKGIKNMNDVSFLQGVSKALRRNVEIKFSK